MKYIDTNTLAVLTVYDIQLLYPTTSFPEGTPDLNYLGYPYYAEVVQPTYDSITQGVQEITPVLAEDGIWYQTWEVYALTQEEIDANTAAANAALRKSITDDVMKSLDDFAATRNYSSIFATCTYATSIIPKFQQEAVCCVTLRDNTWVACYQILAEVQAGTRPVPSGYADIAADLPVLEWPPVADFSASVTSGVAPLEVTFTSLSTDARTYAWDFNNDTTVDDTIANPVYTFDTAGTYTVRLAVSNSMGTSEEIKTAYIVVSEPPPPGP